MLSIIIITKNEEEVIEDCIKSAKPVADEVIVVDDYSDDKTVDIAKKLGARIVQNRFVDFSAQRNFAMSLAKNNWVLFLDADERLTPEFIKELKSIINRERLKSDTIGGYFIKRKTYYYGRDWGFSDKVQRLFYKPNFTEWKGQLHETPYIKGEYSEINSPILHFTHRNLSQMVKKTNNWSEYEAGLRLKAHHPKMNVFRFGRIIITGFFRSYIKEKGYKNGTEGVIEAIYQAFSMFITYAKLWEKQNSSN